MKKILLILWLLPLILQGQTNYYVSNTGSDANNGLSHETAWATVSKVSGTVFSAGDSILFERGGTWGALTLTLTASGSAGAPIVYGAYGTGEKPIIDGKYEYAGWDTEGNWSDQGGNVWRRYFNQESSTDGNLRIRFYADTTGVMYELERKFPDEVDVGQWGFNDDGDSLYIYARENPATYYNYIERTSRAYTFITATERNYITFENLDIRGHFYFLTATGCSNWVIQDCDIGADFGYQVITARGFTTTSSDWTIKNNTFDNNNPHLVYWKGGRSSTQPTQITYDGFKLYKGVQDWDIYDNTFRKWGHSIICLYTAPGHISVNTIEGINIYNNYFTADSSNYGRAFAIDIRPDWSNADNPVRVFNNVAKNMGVRSQIAGSYIEVFNNIFNGSVGRYFDPDAGGGEALGIQGYASESYQMKVYNNVFANAGSYGLWIMDVNPGNYSINECVFANNIFYKNRGRNASDHQLMIGSSDNGLIRDNEFYNNLFYSENTESVIGNGSISLTVAQFNALTTGNTYAHTTSGNLFGDPDFTDPLADDFTIDNTSPAYNVGYSPTLSSADAAGRLWKTPPSIGAYEWYTEVPPVDYTLYINILGGGSVEVEGVVYTTSLTFEDNTVVNLEALHVEGYTEFLGWTGDLISLDAIETITMDSDKTITANFTVMPGSIILHGLGLNEIILF